MAHFSTVIGGSYVSTGRWIDAVRRAGCRFELHPRSEASLEGVQAELHVRFGHPLLDPDRDFVFWVDVEQHLPPPDAPPVVVDRWRDRLERLRALNAPDTLVDHCTIVVAFFDGGAAAVVEALRDRRAEITQRSGGRDVEGIDELIGWWERGGGPSPTLRQEWLLRTPSCMSEVVSLAGWVLAAAYADASGGRLLDDDHPFGADHVPAKLEAIREGMRSWGYEPPGDPITTFTSWDDVELEEDEPQEDEPQEDEELA